MSVYKKPKNPSVSLLRRKQRKMRFTATGTTREKMMSSQLSKDLRQQYGIRRTILNKDDVVEICIGKFKGKKGKVVDILLDSLKVHVEDCTVVRSTGGTAFVPIDPSNLRIIELALNEQRRVYLENTLHHNQKIKEKYAIA